MSARTEDKVARFRAAVFEVLATETSVAVVIDMFSAALRDQGFINEADLIENVATASAGNYQ